MRKQIPTIIRTNTTPNPKHHRNPPATNARFAARPSRAARPRTASDICAPPPFTRFIDFSPPSNTADPTKVPQPPHISLLRPKPSSKPWTLSNRHHVGPKQKAPEQLPSLQWKLTSTPSASKRSHIRSPSPTRTRPCHPRRNPSDRPASDPTQGEMRLERDVGATSYWYNAKPPFLCPL